MSIGELHFADGVPRPKTTAMLFDHLDFLRGVEVFLNRTPRAPLEGLRRGLGSVAGETCHKGIVADRLMDSNPLFLTSNTDTVYALAALDIDRDGPTVIEAPLRLRARLRRGRLVPLRGRSRRAGAGPWFGQPLSDRPAGI